MIDLHVHSNNSDGSLSPSELISLGLEKGLHAIALTDHDTTEGLAEFREAAKGTTIEAIPGIEFSTEYEGKDIHIVGLFIDETQSDFQEHLKNFVASRDARNVTLCEKLAAAGIDISYEALRAAYPTGVLTRAHYARYLVDKGVCLSVSDAFSKYLGDNTPFFIPRKKVPPYDAISIISKSGGFPILAHPILYHMGDARLNLLVSRLKEAGLMGIEVKYSTYTNQEENRMRQLAVKYNLLMSGGSDFHGAAKPKVALGTGYGHLAVPDEFLFSMKERLS